MHCRTNASVICFQLVPIAGQTIVLESEMVTSVLFVVTVCTLDLMSAGRQLLQYDYHGGNSRQGAGAGGAGGLSLYSRPAWSRSRMLLFPGQEQARGQDRLLGNHRRQLNHYYSRYWHISTLTPTPTCPACPAPP